MYEEYNVAYIVVGSEEKLQQEVFQSKGIPFLLSSQFPYMIYRVQLPNNDADDIRRMPRWDGDCKDSKLTTDFFMADRAENLGPRAPYGRVCDSYEDLRENGCGFSRLAEILNE